MNIESNTVENSTQPAMVGLQYVRRIFSKGKINLLNADCMQIMKQYPDKYFDLAITDPPYGLGDRLTDGGHKKNPMEKYRKDYEEKRWDEAPEQTYFDELFRISKNQIIWGGNYFKLPPTRGILCWDKKIMMPTFSRWEFGWTSFDKPAKLFNKHSGKSNRIHINEKPVELYDFCFDYAKTTKEMKIIDTHGGSFNSAISAHYLGFSEFLGIEIFEDYFEKSVSNFIEKTRALKLDF